MRKEDIENLMKKAKANFFMNDFENGDCLNLSVAFHSFLSSIKINSHVIPIMRHVDQNDLSVLFDHAVLFIEIEEREIDKNFSSEYTFDINGSNAYDKWIESSTFKDEVRFWANKPPSDLEQFCATSQEQYGDIHMKKMLNNKILRDEIFDFLKNEARELID